MTNAYGTHHAFEAACQTLEDEAQVPHYFTVLNDPTAFTPDQYQTALYLDSWDCSFVKDAGYEF